MLIYWRRVQNLTLSLKSNSSALSLRVFSLRVPICWAWGIICADLNLLSSIFLRERARVSLDKRGITYSARGWYSVSLRKSLRVASLFLESSRSRKVEEERCLWDVRLATFYLCSGEYWEMKLDFMLVLFWSLREGDILRYIRTTTNNQLYITHSNIESTQHQTTPLNKWTPACT